MLLLTHPGSQEARDEVVHFKPAVVKGAAEQVVPATRKSVGDWRAAAQSIRGESVLDVRLHTGKSTHCTVQMAVCMRVSGWGPTVARHSCALLRPAPAPFAPQSTHTPHGVA